MKTNTSLSRRNFILSAGAFAALAGLSACSTSGGKGGAAVQAGGNVDPSAIKEPDEITMVWYPNESATEFDAGRAEFGKVLEKGVGKPVKLMTTTDYNVAIEAISSGKAQIAYMGAEGFVQAEQKNPAVIPLVTTSDANGKLDEAIYYSRLAVQPENGDEYKTADGYSIDPIKGKRMSFVSPSSTSGFKVPSAAIVKHFGLESSDELTKPGFFSEVLFGNTHQGSCVNLLLGDADVAAVDDVDLVEYLENDTVEGEPNQPGAIYKVKEGAAAPFDRVIGKEFLIIQSTPVLNAPLVVNSNELKPETIENLTAALTDPANKDNPLLFAPKDQSTGALWKQKGENNFIKVESSWYDPIRAL